MKKGDKLQYLYMLCYILCGYGQYIFSTLALVSNVLSKVDLEMLDLSDILLRQETEMLFALIALNCILWTDRLKNFVTSFDDE